MSTLDPLPHEPHPSNTIDNLPKGDVPLQLVKHHNDEKPSPSFHEVLDSSDGPEPLRTDNPRNTGGHSLARNESEGFFNGFSNRFHDSATLAFAVLRYLPHPLIVLDAQKTLVLTNKAMGILLGVEDDEGDKEGDNGTSALDLLHGQTLSQLGIDMLLDDGSTVWVSWDAFLSSLVDDLGGQDQANCLDLESEGHEVLTGGSRDAAKPLVLSPSKLQRTTAHDAVVNVVLSPRNSDNSADGDMTKAALIGGHTYARMLITVWKMGQDIFFNLTFTSTNAGQSAPHTANGRPRKLLRSTTARSNLSSTPSGTKSPPEMLSSNSDRQQGSGNSKPYMVTSPLHMPMSTSAFPPSGPPSKSSPCNAPSSLQKAIILKDALLDNTEVPVTAMWKDGSFAISNKAARQLFNVPSDLRTFSNGNEFAMLWEAWDENFTRMLEPSEIPISVLIRTESPFASRKIGIIDSQTKRRRTLDCVGEAIRDEQTGEFLAGLVTARDITTMTETINDLRQKDEQRFQLICDMMPQMIWTTSPEGLSDWFSTRWYEYTGLSEEESMGTGWMTPFHPDDLPESGRRWAHAVETGTLFYTEYRCRDRHGEWRWMLGRALPWRNKATGEIEKWFGTCTDVHEAVEAKFEARRTRQQLLSVIGHAKVTVFSVDRNRSITLLEGALIWNNQESPADDSSDRTGGEEYIGANIYEVLRSANDSGSRIPPSLHPIEDILNGKSTEDINEDYIDGRWYRTRFVPLLGKTTTNHLANDASIDGVIAVSMDITELKDRELEIQLQEKENARLLANEQAAKEASRMKSQFLANMSHEIRTPIAGVIGMAELLLDQELNEDQRDCAENIQISANGLLTVINDILDISKVESGRLDIEEVQFSLSLVVRDVQKVLGFAAERKNLKFESEIDVGVEEDLIVVGDPGRVRQIITNLLTNSIKFTTNGKVKFSVLKDRETTDILQVKFVVEDTGIGIEEEVQKRLFRPFSQADSSTARRFGGTGLGLTISKNLVDLMHGQISLESTLGQGTRTTFWIPFIKPQFQNGKASLVEMGDLPDRLQSEISVSCYSSDYEQANRTPQGRMPDAPNGHHASKSLGKMMSPKSAEYQMTFEERAKIHVLLVEDNQINQQIALRTIRKLGFSVSAVWNGKEALDYLLAVDSPNPPHPHPNIILMDVQMPIIDGYKATHLIRNHAPFSRFARHIPIVAMTASAIQGDRERCKKAGMDDYLAKPVKGQTLEKMLLRWAMSKRDLNAPTGGSNSSNCSEPDQHDYGTAASPTQRYGNGEGSLLNNASGNSLEAKEATECTKMGPQSLGISAWEGEEKRAAQYVEVEEEVIALKDDKSIGAESGLGEGMEDSGLHGSHRDAAGKGKGQKLTIENVAKLQRETK